METDVSIAFDLRANVFENTSYFAKNAALSENGAKSHTTHIEKEKAAEISEFSFPSGLLTFIVG